MLPHCCTKTKFTKDNRRYVDVGSGTDTATAFQAEDFADSAVSTTKVMVSQGGDGASDLTNLPAVTTTEAETYNFDLFILKNRSICFTSRR